MNKDRTASIIAMHKLKDARITKYNKNPKRCVTCNSNIPYEKRYNKFCSHSCAASHNNIGVRRNFNENVRTCNMCNNILDKSNRHKYCSDECKRSSRQVTRNAYIAAWKLGKINVLSKRKMLVHTIRTYIREKYNNRCCLCGWNKTNPYTKKVPVVVDHIDGHWENNKEENLRLLCPSCDSLQKTYCGANKGNGRGYIGKNVIPTKICPHRLTDKIELS